MKYSLAVDIGASSGRVILGSLENDQLLLQEIHRFDNHLIEKNGHFCWDIDHLFTEIKTGIQKCNKQNIKPVSIGIDTWAVDFVLLDENDQLLTDAIAYRDPRTDGMMEEVFQIIDKKELYSRTGIQFLPFNTIYQLYALKKESPDILEKAKTFLMIPDYLNFLLTGKKVNEYTNASSTQLLNATTKQWDRWIIEKLGFNVKMFQDIQLPKSNLGSLREELVQEFGFNMDVILPATHDTGSAVLSVPMMDDTIYISSGTWSLIGVENQQPICDGSALTYNFTNEGGMDYRFRFLKNIMGLWMIQEVRRMYDNRYSYAEFAKMSQQFPQFHSIVNVDDQRFLKPANMIQEIQMYCTETSQPIPVEPGEIAKCIFDSLAVSYKKSVEEIEKILDKEFTQINVIGGGSQNEVLNQLIADVTNKKVIAGPTEATSIGNLIVQLMALGEISDLNTAKSIIRHSFELKEFDKIYKEA